MVVRDLKGYAVPLPLQKGYFNRVKPSIYLGKPWKGMLFLVGEPKHYPATLPNQSYSAENRLHSEYEIFTIPAWKQVAKQELFTRDIWLNKFKALRACLQMVCKQGKELNRLNQQFIRNDLPALSSTPPFIPGYSEKHGGEVFKEWTHSKIRGLTSFNLQASCFEDWCVLPPFLSG